MVSSACIRNYSTHTHVCARTHINIMLCLPELNARHTHAHTHTHISQRNKFLLLCLWACGCVCMRMCVYHLTYTDLESRGLHMILDPSIRDSGRSGHLSPFYRTYCCTCQKWLCILLPASVCGAYRCVYHAYIQITWEGLSLRRKKKISC